MPFFNGKKKASRQSKPNPLRTTCDDSDGEGDSHCVITELDSDIETDAVPDPPRPRGTPVPGPEKSQDTLDDEPVVDEETPEKTSSSQSKKTGDKGYTGCYREKIPQFGGSRVVMTISKSHNVQIGSNIYYGFNPKHPMGAQEKKEEVPPIEYELLMSSKKVVDDQHLDCVADNIGEKWKMLGKQLRIKDAVLYRCEHDYINDHRERVYQMLSEWKQSTGGPNQAPLLARLSTALWNIRETDALDSLLKFEKDPRLNT